MYQPIGEYDEEEAYEGILSAEILEMRRMQFSEELVAMCRDYCKENSKVDDGLSIKNWPENFDLD
jgi:hypothetical protein